MDLPNFPRNWDMLLFVVGWFSVFFAPQQNKYLLMFAWFLILTGMMLGTFNFLDYEMVNSKLKLTGDQCLWASLIIATIWVAALILLYTFIFPIVYPNLT
jgi:hypothetical protein